MNLFTPAEFSANYSLAGVGKTKLTLDKMLILSIVAGMLIGFPAMVTNMATYGLESNSVVRMVSGLLFAFGLGMVIMTGAELFTGNTLILISVLDRKVTIPAMLRNWVVVYIGNFIGSAVVAFICARFNWMAAGGNALADCTMRVAQAKRTMRFENALMMGIFCNVLVTLAVLLSLAGKDGVSRILGAWGPVMFFVVCGFNHSIADMTYCMAGLFAKKYYALQAAAYTKLNWGNYLVGNLIPVTIGNILGGCAVALVVWYCYLRKPKKAK